MKTEILAALGKGMSSESLEVLHGALSDPVRDIRGAASRALADRAELKSMDALISAHRTAELVGNDSPLYALAKIADPSLTSVFVEAAESPYWHQRRAAGAGLGVLAENGNMDAIERILSDPSWIVWKPAVLTLTGHGGPQSARLLLVWIARKSLQDPDLLADRFESFPWKKTFSSLFSMNRETIAEACASVRQDSSLAREVRKEVGSLCRRIRRHWGERQSIVFSTAEGHAVLFSPFNATARRVTPHESDSATAWKGFVGTENGGIDIRLRPGK